MKSGIKTLATWLILGIIFIVLLNSVFNKTDTKMSYSELMNSISNAQVSEIRLTPSNNKAYVTLKDGESTGARNAEKEVIIPSIDTFMEQISDDIEFHNFFSS